MKKTVQVAERNSREREALRSRVKRFYRRFNKGEWDACFRLIDPRLTEQGKVKLNAYSNLMQSFKDVYGSVRPRWTHLSLHLDAAPKQHDQRPFAFVYVIWQDDAHGFHMFRERWVRDNGQWYTRVVGLVPNRQATDSKETDQG